MIGIGSRRDQIGRRQSENLLNGKCRRSIRTRRKLLRVMMVRMMHLLLLMSQIHHTRFDEEVNQWLMISLLTFVNKNRNEEDDDEGETRKTNLSIIGRRRERERMLRISLSFLFFSFSSLTKPIRTCFESNEKRKNEKKKRGKEGIGSTSLIFLSMGQSQSG